eukprot:Phypoly_transcript_10875.p1 GENE.Phypoly_transcript_10875~~Phypoly_transcript_10875.p1  ORF type:complete len:278 (+),score=19.52 Phypoly_transcript_10875:241-1074(+)
MDINWDKEFKFGASSQTPCKASYIDKEGNYYLYDGECVFKNAQPLAEIGEKFKQHTITTDELTSEVNILGDGSKLICINTAGKVVLSVTLPRTLVGEIIVRNRQVYGILDWANYHYTRMCKVDADQNLAVTCEKRLSDMDTYTPMGTSRDGNSLYLWSKESFRCATIYGLITVDTSSNKDCEFQLLRVTRNHRATMSNFWVWYWYDGYETEPFRSYGQLAAMSHETSDLGDSLLHSNFYGNIQVKDMKVNLKTGNVFVLGSHYESTVLLKYALQQYA